MISGDLVSVAAKKWSNIDSTLLTSPLLMLNSSPSGAPTAYALEPT
jgi:hypothetical protein